MRSKARYPSSNGEVLTYNNVYGVSANWAICRKVSVLLGVFICMTGHPAISSFSELRNKDVINLCDGKLLGCICDMEFNTVSGEITAIILPGDGIFASLSAKNRVVIPWKDIERIGKDAILVQYNGIRRNE